MINIFTRAHTAQRSTIPNHVWIYRAVIALISIIFVQVAVIAWLIGAPVLFWGAIVTLVWVATQIGEVR